MALTALDVETDRNSYSRYEDGRDVVVATVTPTFAPSPSPTAVKVALIRRRRSGDHELVSVTLSFTTATPQDATFALGEIQQDGYCIVRRSEAVNDYRIEAAAGDIKSAAKFTVTPTSLDMLKAQYLFGATLHASEVLAPRLQPQAITGVRVVDVGKDSILGASDLVFTSPSTLKWGDGPAVPISTVSRRRYLLQDGGPGFIIVQVTPGALPGATTTESLFIDHQQMTDEVLLDQMINTVDAIERDLTIPLEPTIVVSKMLVDKAPWYDRVVDGQTFYQAERRWEWIRIQVPYYKLRKVYNLQGWFNQSKVVTIEQGWIKATESNGLIQLVPSAGVPIMVWIETMPIYQFAYPQTIPDFWQFHILQGLDGFTSELTDFCAMRAAIPVLSFAALGRNPAGATNESISRDGVSESRGFNQAGANAVLIQRYQQETGMPMMQGRGGRGQQGDPGIDRLRMKYRGLAMTVF